MNLTEIFDRARSLLDDKRAPYLWSDIDLLGYLNAAINEAAEKAKLFKDSITAEVCQKTILAADPSPDYLLDTRVLKVESAKLSTRTLPLERKPKAEMDAWRPDWRNAPAGTPRCFITDYSEGYLTLCPKSDADATLYMTVLRLPLNQMSLSQMDASPEIHFRHHFRLIDGILAQAYEKDDSQTLDPEKAERHRQKWLAHIDEMARGRIMANQGNNEFLGPKYGAI